MKENKLLLWLRNSTSYVWLVAAAAYLAVSAGQAVLDTYLANQETSKLEEELQIKEQQRARLEALVVYYQTDNYKEKELRRALLLKMPGEKVYALPESSVAKAAEEEVLRTKKEHDPRLAIPTWRQWLAYLTQG